MGDSFGKTQVHNILDKVSDLARICVEGEGGFARDVEDILFWVGKVTNFSLKSEASKVGHIPEIEECKACIKYNLDRDVVWKNAVGREEDFFASPSLNWKAQG